MADHVYNPHTWATGETITAARFNALEQAAAGAAQVADVADGTTTTGAALKAAYVAGRACSTDGTNSLPTPAGVGLEFVITTTGGVTGLQDIRFNGASL